MDTVAERRLELRMASRTIAVIASLGVPRNVGIDEWACACTTRFADEVRSEHAISRLASGAVPLAKIEGKCTQSLVKELIPTRRRRWRWQNEQLNLSAWS